MTEPSANNFALMLGKTFQSLEYKKALMINTKFGNKEIMVQDYGLYKGLLRPILESEFGV